MNIGYARTSRGRQNLDVQRRALKTARCADIYEDRGDSDAAARPGLSKALNQARKGDVLVVCKLDRLARSLPHLVEIVSELSETGVGFRSLYEQIDMTGACGDYSLRILAAIAEFEREISSEQTRAGMAEARRRGKHVGRPRKLTAGRVAQAERMVAAGLTRKEIAAFFRVDVATLRRALKRR